MNASLNTEDLVERSHVEERYEEALALMPLAPAPAKEPEGSSRARGLRQANAAKNGKVAAAPKQRPPAENASARRHCEPGGRARRGFMWGGWAVICAVVVRFLRS